MEPASKRVPRCRQEAQKLFMKHALASPFVFGVDIILAKPFSSRPTMLLGNLRKCAISLFAEFLTRTPERSRNKFRGGRVFNRGGHGETPRKELYYSNDIPTRSLWEGGLRYAFSCNSVYTRVLDQKASSRTTYATAAQRQYKKTCAEGTCLVWITYHWPDIYQ
jgi:hypothetical protein